MMAALKLQEFKLKLGQVYYHENMGWSVICAEFKTSNISLTIDQTPPREFYDNINYPPKQEADIPSDIYPVKRSNPSRFTYDSVIYFTEAVDCDGSRIAVIKWGYMRFLVNNDRVLLNVDGVSKKIPTSLCFEYLFGDKGYDIFGNKL